MKRLSDIYFCKKNIKIILFFTFIIFFMPNGHAFDLDETVDDAIRKNYNSDKINQDYNIQQYTDNKLPVLPSIIENEYKNKHYNNISSQKVHTCLSGNTKIHAGTIFEVSNITQISDWQKKHTILQFKTKKMKKGRHYTIPQGTIFKAEIIEVHKPQFSCNGGLIVIKIYSMIYKGKNIPINGYVTVANDKKIFFNNIKGKRTFLSTMYKNGNWGRTLFGQMLNLTISLGKEGSTLILSPFPFIYGTICLTANALISPITAFFSKGGHISIPAGSNFKIRIIEDIYID